MTYVVLIWLEIGFFWLDFFVYVLSSPLVVELLVVNFHYIRDHKPLQEGIYPRSLSEFKSQINTLGKHYQFISQCELSEILKSSSFPESKFCMITFDDNLKEQMDAFEFLKSCSIPAIFFSTTLPYTDRKVHDVHKFHHVLTEYSDDELFRILQSGFDFDNATFEDDLYQKSYRYDNPKRKRIKLFLNYKLSESARSDFVNQLFMKSIHSTEMFCDNFYMTADDLRRIAGADMLGTHSHSHFLLSTLSENKIASEIRISMDYLFDLTGKKIKAIAYPYGYPAAVNDVVFRVAENVGLEFGFTMIRGFNHNEDLKNRLSLKRVDTNDAPGGKLSSELYLPTEV